MIDILDTHQHLIYNEKFKYSWAKDIEILANRSFTLEDYTKLSSQTSINSAIFMEVDVDEQFYQDEARFLKKIAEDKNNLNCGVIAHCIPETNDGFDKWLNETNEKQYVGYRRVLHTQDDNLSQTSTFRSNINKIGKNGKVFDICMLEKQLPIAYDLIKNCDDTQFVLDHCGIPDISSDYKNWKIEIAKIAKLPNVVCKISGLLTGCDANKDFKNQILPYFEYCIEAFGWDRVIWGGDWPVVNLTSNLVDWVKISQDIVKNEDILNQEKLFSLNAKRVYKL